MPILDGVGGYSCKPVKIVVLPDKKFESVVIFHLAKPIGYQAITFKSIVRGAYREG